MQNFYTYGIAAWAASQALLGMGVQQGIGVRGIPGLIRGGGVEGHLCQFQMK